MFPYELDGQVLTCRDIERLTGSSRKIIAVVIDAHHPVTLADLKAAIRAYLATPKRVVVRPESRLWNNRSPLLTAKLTQS